MYEVKKVTSGSYIGMLFGIFKHIIPISKHEMRRFIPMCIMIFCILFNYSMLYSLKDSLVMPFIGAEAISFIEISCVLPVALFFTITYIKVSSVVKNKSRIFFTIIGIFLGFFAIFAFFLYPNQDKIHPDPVRIQELSVSYPYFKWMILIYGKWLFALFSVFSEIWINAMLSLLFWQLANHITDIKEAKRFYPTLGLIGNLSLIFSGIALKYLANRHDDSQYMVSEMISAVLISGLICAAAYYYIVTKILTNPNYKPKTKIKQGVKKIKMSLRDSLSVIMGSRYLWFMAIMVIAYGVTINITQGLWKSEVKKLYPTPQQYALFMSGYQQWIGMTSTCFMIIGGMIVRRFSWATSNLITPIITLVTGLLFFIFVIVGSYFDYMSLGFNPVLLAVTIGMSQIILSKSSKFSLFDSTKEMAYIPLEEEYKIRGKAAVDVLGERIGKSGGAFIQSFLFMILPMASYAEISPCLLVIFAIFAIAWIIASKKLNVEYLAKLDSYDNS